MADTTPPTPAPACTECGSVLDYHTYIEAGNCGATTIDLWRCPACGHVEYGDAHPASDLSCGLHKSEN